MNNIFNVNSFRQSGGITAGQINIFNKPKQRHLTEKVKKEAHEILNKDKDKIIIQSVIGDQEAFTFASEIEAFLKEENYNFKIKGVLQTLFSSPIIGKNIFIERDPTTNDTVTLTIGTNMKQD